MVTVGYKNDFIFRVNRSSKAYYKIRMMLISKETRHFNLLDP
jgi:hypothetical protein